MSLTTRSWTDSGAGPDCQLCADVTALLGDPPPQDMLKMTASWSIALQAFAMLKLEKKLISRQSLLDRHGVLMSVQCVGGDVAGVATASPSKSQYSTLSAHTPRSAAESDIDLPPSTNMSKKVRLSHKQPSSSSCSSRRSCTWTIGPCTSTSTKPSATDDNDDDELIGDYLESTGSDNEADPIHPLSVKGTFEAGDSVQSVMRFRKTISEYALCMCDLGWYESFKIATVKALERRLLPHETTVMTGANIDLLRAFCCLKSRVRAIIKAYCILKQWVKYADPQMLIRFRNVVQIISQFFDFLGESHSFASDLKIVLALAKFHEDLQQSQSILQSFKGMDIDNLKACFLVLEDGVMHLPIAGSMKMEERPPSPPPEASIGVHDVSTSGSSRKSKMKAPTHKVRAREFTVLVRAPTAMEFVGTTLDRALKDKLHKMKASQLTDDFDSVVALYKDIAGTVEEWRNKFGAEQINNIIFADLLDSIATIFKVSVDTRSPSSPAHVRDARTFVNMASNPCGGVAAFKCAEAMMCYAGTKPLMSRAKAVASSGLQDQAADASFAQALSALETAFRTGFEDIDAFATSGNSGSWQTPETMHAHIHLLKQKLISVRLVSDQWSLSRLEEQSESVDDIFSYAAFILDIGSIIAANTFASSFSGELQAAGVGRCEPIGQMALAVASVHTEVKTEVMDSDVHHDSHADALPPSATSLGGNEAGPLTAQALEFPAGFSHLVASLAPTFDRIANLMKMLMDTVNVAHTLHSILVDRMGLVFLHNVQAVDAVPQDTLNLTMKNKEVLDSLMQYVIDMAYLEVRVPLSLAADDPVAGSQEHIDRLASFCLAHRKFGSEIPLDMQTMADMEGLLDSTGFSRVASELKMIKGERLLATHAFPTLNSALDTLENMQININPVDNIVIDDIKKVETMFNIVVEAPLAQSLSSWFTGAQLGDFEVLANHMRSWKHNRLLKNLTDFVAALGLSDIKSNTIRNLAQPHLQDQPAEIVLLALSLKALLYDIAAIAAAIHTQFIMETTSASPPSAMNPEMITTKMPYMLKQLTDCLSVLESRVESPEYKALEAGGWRLEVSVSMARSWKTAMLSFGKRALDLLLNQWAVALTAVSQEAKGHCPAWEACLQQGVWNDKLATSMLVGKQKSVVRAHNTLYEYIQKITNAASIIDVSPRVQDNPLNSESVTVALHTLASLKTAAVVCDGQHILVTYVDSTLGPTKAAAFLQKNDIASYPSVPMQLWQLLQSLAAEEVAPGDTVAPLPNRKRIMSVKEQADEETPASTVVKAEAECNRGDAGSSAHGHPARVKGEPSRRALKRRRE